MELVFLALEEVIAIHDDQIARYGGQPGIRDNNLLLSAIAAPAAGGVEGYYHTGLFEMAAAYLYHIVADHPFIDGNKRTGAVAVVIFLEMNNCELAAGEYEFERLVRKVANGKAGKPAIARFFLRNSGSKGCREK